MKGEVVGGFEFYVKREKECEENRVMGYMKCVKKIRNVGVGNEWIGKEGFMGMKLEEKEVMGEFVSMDEVVRM